MSRLKLPQSLKDEMSASSKKKAAEKAVDPKQTLIGSFFDPIPKKTLSLDNSDDDNDNKSNVYDNNKQQLKNNKSTPTTIPTTTTTTTIPKPAELPILTKKRASTKSLPPPKPVTTSKKQPSITRKQISDDDDEQSGSGSESEEEEKVKKPTISPKSKKSPAKKEIAKQAAKPTTTTTTTTTTRSTRTRGGKVDLTNLITPSSDEDEEESDSDDGKMKKKLIGKKRKQQDSDFESDNSDTESEQIDSDDGSGSVSEQEQELDEDLLYKPKNKKKQQESTKNKMDTTTDGDSDKEMKDLGDPIIIGKGGRIILPAGTPEFQSDPKQGKKLLKAHSEYQSKQEQQRQQQQNGGNINKESGGDNEEEEEEEEKQKKPTKGKGSKTSAKSKGPAYTPLEQQFISIKKDNPDTVLMVECGYKYKFFGDDASVANKVLNIYSYVAKNFLNASIPTQRLYFHLRRLVMAGYKVGVVEQTETAALKAISSSKSQPFERKLTRVYTSSTFIDDDVEDSIQNSTPQYLVSFYESANSTNNSESTTISFVAVSIRTGEIVYDSFKDNIMRSQLETILTHIKPSEILIPPSTSSSSSSSSKSIYKFSNLTLKCLKSYSKSNNVRNQTMDIQIFDYEVALGKLIEFYEDCNCEDVLDHIKKILNKDQIICLGTLLTYLDQFIHFASILQVASNFKAFRISNHLVLPHSTIVNLELLENESDKHEKGSLLWLLNRTSTASGSRLFRQWICKPLVQYDLILSRQNAVEELVNSLKTNSPITTSISTLFKSHIPDLQRNLSRIYYKVQCTPKEFLNTMASLKRIVELFIEINNGDKFKSELLISILKMVQDKQDNGNKDEVEDVVESSQDKLTKRINYFLSNINSEIAKDYATVDCDKSNLWISLEKHENIQETKDKIKTIQDEFKKILKSIRTDLKKPALEYLHMPKLNFEYLIELPPSFKGVPKNWIKVNSTQKSVRYHVPEILDQIKLLQQSRETLKAQSQEAWLLFLNEFSMDYSLFSNFVYKISTLDCLFSLALVSCNLGYVKPNFVSDDEGAGIQIENGRHPIVEVIFAGGGSSNSYVPNSISLLNDKQKSMIITGPNMGGKSTCIRQTALIVIMAQLGCYVPATSCTLSVVDAIYTRIGAHDNLGQGKSTFFVELQETSEILKYATHRSLIILDELGRGTSTHDGVSIAYSTLKYILETKKCFCLFVTHYPLLSQLELQFPNLISNYHMGFIEQLNNDSGSGGGDAAENLIPKVIFLYKLVQGAAQNSYGLNVASIAGLPKQVLIVASEKSNEMKESITKRANISSSNNNNGNDDINLIENEITTIIKNWNSKRLQLTPTDLSQFIDNFKAIQLKLNK